MTKGQHKVSRGARVVGALAWAGIVAVCSVLVVVVLVPAVTGSAALTVLTGSMRPQLEPGTLVVVRPTPITQIGAGDVVTYQLASGKPEVVTHRVVATRVNARGETELQTQGDANPVPDPQWVREVQLRGTLWYEVPFVGRVTLLSDPHTKRILSVALAACLVGYAGWMFLGAWRQRRRGTVVPGGRARVGVSP